MLKLPYTSTVVFFRVGRSLVTYCYSLQSFYHIQKRQTSSEINSEKGDSPPPPAIFTYIRETKIFLREDRLRHWIIFLKNYLFNKNDIRNVGCLRVADRTTQSINTSLVRNACAEWVSSNTMLIHARTNTHTHTQQRLQPANVMWYKARNTVRQNCLNVPAEETNRTCAHITDTIVYIYKRTREMQSASSWPALSTKDWVMLKRNSL
jgi:hypothetical protein